MINKYTFENTHGLISSVVNEREIYQAILVMVNVAAFKGLWRHQFRLNDTYYGNFYVAPEKYVQVPMMKQEGQFRNGGYGVGVVFVFLSVVGDLIILFVCLYFVWILLILMLFYDCFQCGYYDFNVCTGVRQG